MGGDEGSYQRHLSSRLNSEGSGCPAIAVRWHILPHSAHGSNWDKTPTITAAGFECLKRMALAIPSRSSNGPWNNQPLCEALRIRLGGWARCGAPDRR